MANGEERSANGEERSASEVERSANEEERSANEEERSANEKEMYFGSNITAEYNKEGYMKFDIGVRYFILLSDSSLKFLVKQYHKFYNLCGFADLNSFTIRE